MTDDELRASIPESTRGQRAEAARRSQSRGASQQQASPRRSRSRERPTPSLSPAPKSARGSPEWKRGETKAQREAKASSDAVDPLGATPGPMPPMPQISQSMQTPASKARGRPRTTLTTGAEEADPVSKRSCTPAGGRRLRGKSGPPDEITSNVQQMLGMRSGGNPAATAPRTDGSLNAQHADQPAAADVAASGPPANVPDDGPTCG